MCLPEIGQGVNDTNKVNVFPVGGDDAAVVALVEGDGRAHDLLRVVLHDT